jgi:hypothetical protein
MNYTITVASLLFAQAAAAPIPIPASVTPLSVTVPIYDLKCEMTDLDGQRFDMAIHQAGGRGYSRAAVRSGATGVNWTDIEVTVTSSSNRYGGLKLSNVGSDKRWPGIRRGQITGGRTGTVQFQSFPTAERGKIVLIIQPEWPLDPVSAYGRCSVQETPQVPLSDAEAVEYAAK